jgi:uncharacterized protein (DUF1697 family)
MNMHVALLRAVNVGGRNAVAMKQLRTWMEQAGLRSVSTYLQSGNVVFAAEDRSPRQSGAEIEDLIARHAKLTIRVLVRTTAELERVVALNPLEHAAEDPRRLHVMFLDEAPSVAAFEGLDPADLEPDVFVLDGRHLYMWYPEGIGNSRLGGAFWERRLRVTGTARNWNTVTKLLELAGG